MNQEKELASNLNFYHQPLWASVSLPIEWVNNPYPGVHGAEHPVVMPCMENLY